MQTTQSGSQQSPIYAENAHNSNSNSDKLIERIQSDEEPKFTIIGSEEKGYFATLGQFKISETYETIEEVERAIMNRDYHILFALMNIAAEHTYNHFKKQELEQFKKVFNEDYKGDQHTAQQIKTALEDLNS